MVVSRVTAARADAVRVLLVEPDDGDYRRACEILDSITHASFALERAPDLAGGLALLREGEFDVLLLEAALPDGEGLEIVRVAQSRQHRVPVVILSGRPTLELDLEAMALGASDFLDKSRIDAALLERTIRYAIWQRRQAERLSRLAQHDELTGLANRALFHDRLERALAWARRQGRMVAVMILDLNGFKPVNDKLGHVAGDRLLKICARRLVQRLRETDTVARLGGDEYALIIENLAKREHAGLVARKVLDSIAPPVSIDRHEVRVTASVGLALYPKDAEDPRAHAPRRRCHVPGQGGGGSLCRFSSPEFERRLERGALLESDLRRALDGGEFALHFQPQVRLAGREVAVSAQIRWRHPELGLIDAERFVALAEDSGLLEPLTDWLFEAGCSQLARWRALGLHELHLALPLLSCQRLAWTDLARRLDRHLAAADLPADRLELEIDEELLLYDADRGGTGVSALKQYGLRLAMQGFGRGPTSLRGLRLGVLTTLKLGRELLKAVPDEPQAAALLGAVIALARDLGLRVVAEGAETQEHLAFLRERGCSAVQAFMSCPPLPAEACTGWLCESLRATRPDASPSFSSAAG
jgi:diguanylate cyclase